ncbi:thiol-disulfide oxidoreductase DCC family protein [Oligoflexus tunisiensis]|uniref:thiol-disulfide oxidoreductase DCC family protein n=1 Tax=Oligoflexus tunisiensis TaxID=708132 RepID=UPI00114CD696|nr:DUF393 domain-containing protein [Oligoflexus tunisiensis]
MRQEDQGSYIVFYDEQCPICRRSRRFLERLGDRPRMHFVDVNNRSVMKRWPMIDPDKALKRVTVLTPRFQQLTDYRAVIELLGAKSRLVHWFLPLLRLPVISWVGRLVYHFISHNRYGIGRWLQLEDDAPRRELPRRESMPAGT